MVLLLCTSNNDTNEWYDEQERRAWSELRMNEMAHDKLDIHNFCFQFYLNRFPRWEKLPLIWNKRPCLEHEMYRSLYQRAKCIEHRANLLFSFGVINFSSCCTNRILLCAASQRMKWTRRGKKELGNRSRSNIQSKSDHFWNMWNMDARATFARVNKTCRAKDIENMRWISTTTMWCLLGGCWWIWLLHQSIATLRFLVWHFYENCLWNGRWWDEWVVRTFDFYFTSFFIMCL